jgi:hypothetical protein
MLSILLHVDPSGQQRTVVSPARDRHDVPDGQQKLLGKPLPQTSKPSALHVFWRANRSEEGAAEAVDSSDSNTKRLSWLGRRVMTMCVYVCFVFENVFV